MQIYIPKRGLIKNEFFYITIHNDWFGFDTISFVILYNHSIFIFIQWIKIELILVITDTSQFIAIMERGKKDPGEFDNLVDDMFGDTTVDNVLTASTLALTGVILVSSGTNPIVAATDAVVTILCTNMSSVLFKKKYKWVPKAITLGIIVIGVIANRNKKK